MEASSPAPDPAEAMRAKCDDIVRKIEDDYVGRPEAYIMRNIRAEIAALKGKGEEK